MTLLSQREAARRWAMGRATLQRAIRAGRVSAVEGGQIELSEMLRAFGEPVSGQQTVPSEPTLRATHEAAEVARLRAENEGLRAVIDAQKSNLEDIRAQVLRLTHQAEPPAVPPTGPAKGGRYNHTFEAQDGMKADRQPGLWASIKRLW